MVEATLLFSDSSAFADELHVSTTIDDLPRNVLEALSEIGTDVGVLQFLRPQLSVTEGGGVANITVLHTAETEGTISVQYATADVTATAGSDYTATSGTLTLTLSESAKTIAIPILNDGIAEFPETFVVSLRACPKSRGSPMA